MKCPSYQINFNGIKKCDCAISQAHFLMLKKSESYVNKLFSSIKKVKLHVNIYFDQF